MLSKRKNRPNIRPMRQKLQKTWKKAKKIGRKIRPYLLIGITALTGGLGYYFQQKAVNLQKLTQPNSGYVLPPAGDPILQSPFADIDIGASQIEFHSIDIIDTIQTETFNDHPFIGAMLKSVGNPGLNFQHGFLALRRVERPLDGGPTMMRYEVLNPMPDEVPLGLDGAHSFGSLVATQIGASYPLYNFGNINVEYKLLDMDNAHDRRKSIMEWMGKSHVVVIAKGHDALEKWHDMIAASRSINDAAIPYQVDQSDCNSAVNALLLSAGSQPFKTPGKIVTGYNLSVLAQIQHQKTPAIARQ